MCRDAKQDFLTMKIACFMHAAARQTSTANLLPAKNKMLNFEGASVSTTWHTPVKALGWADNLDRIRAAVPAETYSVMDMCSSNCT